MSVCRGAENIRLTALVPPVLTENMQCEKELVLLDRLGCDWLHLRKETEFFFFHFGHMQDVLTHGQGQHLVKVFTKANNISNAAYNVAVSGLFCVLCGCFFHSKQHQQLLKRRTLRILVCYSLKKSSSFFSYLKTYDTKNWMTSWNKSLSIIVDE